MAENVENGIPIKEKPTMGFAVSGAPIWLCKELQKESQQWYGNVYWPVIVDWYRKAKDYELMIKGGFPLVEEKEEIEAPKTEDKSIKLFGGHKGE